MVTIPCHTSDRLFPQLNRVTVNSGGVLVMTVPPRDAIAIHTGARGTGNLVAVSFSETANTNFGEVCSLLSSV